MKNALNPLLNLRIHTTMDDFKKGLFKALSILEDYLQDIVIAGGWAPLIYYHYLLDDKNLKPLRAILMRV